MEKFFNIDVQGNWHHEDLDDQLQKAVANRKKKQRAARKRWGSEKEHANAYTHASDDGMHMQCPSPSPSPSPISTQVKDPKNDVSEGERLADFVAKSGGD